MKRLNHKTINKKFEELQLMAVSEVAAFLNWSMPKVTTYRARHLLPEPVREIGGRPVWYKQDIIDAAEFHNWPTYENNTEWQDPYKDKTGSKKKERVTA